MRLDLFLFSQHKKYSRSIYQKFIKEVGMKVAGKLIKKPHFEVADGLSQVPGAAVEAFVKKLSELPSPDFSVNDLRRIYEDESLIAFDKPAGIKTEEITKNFFPVHRLDKDTSGVLVVAKTLLAQAALQKQWQERSVKKTYWTLLKGKLEPKKGAIQGSILRSAHDRTKMAVSRAHGARHAFTEYEVSEYISPRKGVSETLSLVHAFPQTGRTHQIRVHFASIGHPVVGDSIYGDKHLNAEVRETMGLKRQFLHAEKLELTHPFTKKKLCFEAKLPKDLQNAMLSLSKHH